MIKVACKGCNIRKNELHMDIDTGYCKKCQAVYEKGIDLGIQMTNITNMKFIRPNTKESIIHWIKRACIEFTTYKREREGKKRTNIIGRHGTTNIVIFEGKYTD